MGDWLVTHLYNITLLASEVSCRIGFEVDKGDLV